MSEDSFDPKKNWRPIDPALLKQFHEGREAFSRGVLNALGHAGHFQRFRSACNAIGVDCGSFLDDMLEPSLTDPAYLVLREKFLRGLPQYEISLEESWKIMAKEFFPYEKRDFRRKPSGERS